MSTLLNKCQAGCTVNYKKCEYTCNIDDDNLCAIMYVFVIATCAIGLIFTVTLLFIALVDNGLQSAGIGGFILSLVPPTVIFVIGLCVSREKVLKFYKTVLASKSTPNGSADSNEEGIPANSEPNIHLIQTPDMESQHQRGT